MGLFLGSTLVELLCLVLSTLWLVYWYLTKNYNYWEKRGVPYKKPEFPFGSLKDIVLFRTYIGKGHDDIYKEFPGERFYGIVDIRDPALVVKDPELIKRILVKDFNHFVNRSMIVTHPKDYLSKHLVALIGHEWREMRTKLTPTFTSGKMKLMFELMEQCSHRLKEHLENEIQDGKFIDAKNILARFTLDIIASCAFGLDANSMTDEKGKFFQMFGGITKTSVSGHVKRHIVKIFPSILQVLRLNTTKPEVQDFITGIVRDTIDYRKKNDIRRNDFLDLLSNIKNSKYNMEENGQNNLESSGPSIEGLTLEQMTAQAFVFLIAGFETASSLMAFCLYELSRHLHVQQRLYQEIRKAVDEHEGKVSYQTLMDIPFLEQVINETLRLYGSAHALVRSCNETYNIPDSDLVVEKGVRIFIPIFSLHHDPQYFPDPYAFKPERFAPDEVKKRHPYVFLPFGEGPRNCIGMRFGLLQAKIGLVTVILNFQVDLAPEQEVPISIDKRSLALQPASPVRLRISRRDHGVNL